jgi:chitin synthase
VHDYAENRVDTLHLKNLLHLGEDRYLTTLVLKHFPTYKTKFVRDAHAQTVAPDSASVLLSQRRRWINSTVHNLAELVFLDQLCGFCCFSMRFVVFIDLLSTIVAPVTVAYVRSMSPIPRPANTTDWIFDLFGCPLKINDTHTLDRHACRNIRFAGTGLHLPYAMGHDRLDDL